MQTFAGIPGTRAEPVPAPRQAPPTCVECPVRALALFQPFSDDEVRLIARLRSEFLVLPPKATIIDAAAGRDELYTLFGGWAFGYKIVEDGQRQITRFNLSGDLLGIENAAVTDAGISVEAVTHVSLCAFRKDDLLDAVNEHPTLGAALAWVAAREDSVLAEHMTSLGRRTAVDRVAHLLLELHARLDRRGQVSDSGCPFPLTQAQMADALGLTPEGVNRALRLLREDGLVTLRSRRLTLHDPEALAERAGWSNAYMAPRPLF